MKHQMHLSIETLDAPASAIADVITKVADQVAAELVVLGANRQPVRPAHLSGEALPQIQCRNTRFQHVLSLSLRFLHVHQ